MKYQKNKLFATCTKVYNTIHGTSLKFSNTAQCKAVLAEDDELLEIIETKNLAAFNELYAKHWKPKAEFNLRSSKQMSTLMYEILELPIRFRNPATENMKKKGEQGSPATNEAAIMNALAFRDKPEHKEFLELLIDHKGYLTKESLFLSKYPSFVHWKTGKIHPSLRQSNTTTGRFTCSSPNTQQLPKSKGKEYRSMLKAREGYSFVALDFTGQELRLAADDSRDPNFLACYIGDDKKDPHSLTGLKIANKRGWNMEYPEFVEQVHNKVAEAKEFRTLGKKINFTCQFGAMAPKVGLSLCVPPEEAQEYIDARAEAFPRLLQRVAEWHKECKKRKYALTMLGRRRHLDGPLHYGAKDRDKHGDADRLAYSMRIQGSAAEMTKLAMGEIVRQNFLDHNDDVIPFAVIHDELVVQIKDELITEITPKLVKIMCQQYADMIVPMETEPEAGKLFGELEEVE